MYNTLPLFLVRNLVRYGPFYFLFICYFSWWLYMFLSQNAWKIFVAQRQLFTVLACQSFFVVVVVAVVFFFFFKFLVGFHLHASPDRAFSEQFFCWVLFLILSYQKRFLRYSDVKLLFGKPTLGKIALHHVTYARVLLNRLHKWFTEMIYHLLVKNIVHNIKISSMGVEGEDRKNRYVHLSIKKAVSDLLGGLKI